MNLKNVWKSIVLGTVAIGWSFLANSMTYANYVTVDSNGQVVVDPSLAADTKAQVLSWVAQSADIVLTFFIGLISVLMVVWAIYALIKWIRKKTG